LLSAGDIVVEPMYSSGWRIQVNVNQGILFLDEWISVFVCCLDMLANIFLNNELCRMKSVLRRKHC
jgi:hypothetical protein